MAVSRGEDSDARGEAAAIAARTEKPRLHRPHEKEGYVELLLAPNTDPSIGGHDERCEAAGPAAGSPAIPDGDRPLRVACARPGGAAGHCRPARRGPVAGGRARREDGHECSSTTARVAPACERRRVQ